MILNKLFNVSGLSIYQGPKGKNIKIDAMRDMHSLSETGKEKLFASIEANPNTSVVFGGLPIEHAAWVDGSICLYFARPIDIAIVDSDERVEWPLGPDLVPLEDQVSVIKIAELKNAEPPLHTYS